MGRSTGSKFDLCIHPTVDELSVHPRRHARWGVDPSRISIHMVTMAAINPSILLVCSDCSDGGI